MTIHPHAHDEKPKTEPKQSKENPDTLKENARREKLAKEALATRSNKTLPKGFGQEPTSGGPHAHDEKSNEKNLQEFKQDLTRWQLRADIHEGDLDEELIQATGMTTRRSSLP